MANAISDITTTLLNGVLPQVRDQLVQRVLEQLF